MATGGKREEMDAKLKAWEQDLEHLRVALACAPESVHAQYYPAFTEAFRAKEILRSRWEAIRGVYRPEPADVRQLEEALTAMEAAWVAAQPMLADVMKHQAA
jgi:hypothetical protein